VLLITFAPFYVRRRSRAKRSVLNISEWSGTFNPGKKPWLILGKGPTFQKIRELDISSYDVCSLNHVVRELPVTLAHIIDLDVVTDCADALDRNARFLAMPYRPHVKNKPSEKTLHEFVKEHPLLEKLEKQGRLIWYNLSSSPPHADLPVIKAKFFSAEAALNLLVACGVKVVRSLGIDGGQTYSETFGDLKSKTLLANGHNDFNKQFKGICETIRNTGVFYAPLYFEAPIRVFVGTDTIQKMGVRMLEYSIKKHTPISVEVVPIDDSDVPIPEDPENRSRTGFSFCRFHIPKLCGFKGRAIYMDADMQVFTDLGNLWTWPMGDADVLYCQQPAERGRTPQYSVMLMNCSNLGWDIQKIIRGLDQRQYSYEELMGNCCILAEDRKRMGLPYEWNSLEYYEEGKTSLLHYTDMPTQPWVSNRNPSGQLWYDLLKEAVLEGFVTIDDLYLEIEKGHVSPELPRWAGLPDPGNIEELMKRWIPPYKRFAGDTKSRIAGIPGAEIRTKQRGLLFELRRLLSIR